MVTMVAISLRWWVAWLTTCWSSCQSGWLIGLAVRRLVVERPLEVRRAERRDEGLLLGFERVPALPEIGEAREVGVAVELGRRLALPALEPDPVGAVDVGEHALERREAELLADFLPGRVLAQRRHLVEVLAIAPPVIAPDAPISSSSIARALLVQDGDGVAFLDGLPLGHLDLLHLAGPRRLHRDLHLHGLQHDHGIARGHRVADLARDLEDHARDVRLDVFSH